VKGYQILEPGKKNFFVKNLEKERTKKNIEENLNFET
jgi:hypothetical protein